PRAEDLPPDRLFDLAWQSQVLGRAIEILEERLEARGKRPVFEVFCLYDLRPDGEEVSYEELGERLDLKPDDVKNHLTLARREYREAVRDVVADTVDSGEDLKREMALLLGDTGE
ncbi:MAG TPA: hypothetical protein VEN81_13140, partial [Planctomycetota bacterium]|nr:hypothetical protein [Planctomycetota bacterium]